jgi:2-hydroxy-3-keto-5-methylthiopentenyl-1-phosphate phosphatase
MTGLAVVCDFDGTATVLDIGDEISKHFGGEEFWESESARFRNGELDTRGII